MTHHEARATLRTLGRKVRRLKNGRYTVQGVWPDVSEEGLIIVAQAFEIRERMR